MGAVGAPSGVKSAVLMRWTRGEASGSYVQRYAELLGSGLVLSLV